MTPKIEKIKSTRLKIESGMRNKRKSPTQMRVETLGPGVPGPGPTQNTLGPGVPGPQMGISIIIIIIIIIIYYYLWCIICYLLCSMYDLLSSNY